MFNKLTIRVKLLLGFGALSALFVVLGAYSFWELRSIHRTTEVIATQNVVSIEAISEMSNLVRTMRLAESRHLFVSSESDKNAQATVVSEGIKRLDVLQNQIQSRALSVAEAAAWKEFTEHRAAWLSTHQQLVYLSNDGKIGVEQAQALYANESFKAFAQLSLDLDELVDLNRQASDAAWRDAQEAFAASKMVLGVLVVACVLLALWLGRALSLGITKPLDVGMTGVSLIAAGDMSQSIAYRGADEVSQMLTAVDHMRSGLSQMVLSVRASAAEVASASVEIAQGNHDLSHRTESQASALEETSAGMMDLLSAVKLTAESASKAKELAGQASLLSVSSGEVVANVVQTMKGINESSRKISDIISTIDGIAFQTNILALNAAVEAARAGEQGKGFAVVANEVRNLAQRSGDAAKEIAQLISASVDQVERGAELVNTAGTRMGETVESIQRVNSIMSDLNRLTQDQTLGVAQMQESIASMDQMTQQNAAMVEEVAASAGVLSAKAQDMLQTVSGFKT